MSRGLRPDSNTTPSREGRGRRVLLLVTGGIAAYKACTVVRRLVDAGCDVRVAMTDAAHDWPILPRAPDLRVASKLDVSRRTDADLSLIAGALESLVELHGHYPSHQ